MIKENLQSLKVLWEHSGPYRKPIQFSLPQLLLKVKNILLH